MMWLVEVTILLTSLALITLAYFKWCFTYWSRKGVPYVKPQIPLGNSPNPLFLKRPLFETYREYHDYFKSRSHKYGGIYISARPTLMVVDHGLVRNVLAKDFAHFSNRGVYFNEKTDPLTMHLFSLEGQEWRDLRAKLTPTFTSGKMKMMFHTLLESGNKMIEHLNATHADNTANTVVQIKAICQSYTIDSIGSCAFGLECNSFKNPNSDFIRYGQKLFATPILKQLVLLLAEAFPNLSRKLGVKILDGDVSGFFKKMTQDTIEYRESNNVSRKDFMQLLLEMKQDEMNEKGLTLNQIAAQCLIFFAGGFETSATTMSFALFELARNVDIQEKARREVMSILDKSDGLLTYDGVMEMKYLLQVVNETLRKYPPVPFLNRKCIKDYKIPDSDVVLESGTNVLISVFGLHHDPKHHPEPETFNPDRFSEENKGTIKGFTHIPFGEGPRNCIGLRFGLLQTKVGLSLLLSRYRFTVHPKTVLPMKFNRKAFLVAPENDFFVNAIRIQ